MKSFSVFEFLNMNLMFKNWCSTEMPSWCINSLASVAFDRKRWVIVAFDNLKRCFYRTSHLKGHLKLHPWPWFLRRKKSRKGNFFWGLTKKKEFSHQSTRMSPLSCLKIARWHCETQCIWGFHILLNILIDLVYLSCCKILFNVK